MKKNIIFLFFLLPGFLFSQELIDQRAATVNLLKPEIISKRQLSQTIEVLKENGIDRSEKEILDTMVGDLLLKQGAEREKIRVTDSEVTNAIKKQLGPSGANLTEQQLKDFIRQQTGVTWEKYLEKSKETMKLQRYVQKMKADKLSKVSNPTDDEVKKFYDENSREFFVSKTLRFDHIFVDIRLLSTKEGNDKARVRALGYEKNMKNGSKTFDQLVENSDDSTSKYNNGDFGFLRVDDTRMKNLLGQSFFDSVFSMSKGEISGVVKSNIGYHIIRMKDIIEPRILNINDSINPNNPEVVTTVKQRIETFLIMREQEELFKESLDELVAELKKEAEIKYYL